MLRIELRLPYAKAATGLALEKGLQSPIAQRLFALQLQKGGTSLIAAMKQEAPRDTGRLANSHGMIVDPSRLFMMIFNRADYSVPVHEGRKAGARMPPPDALFAWARRHLVINRIRSERAKLDAGVALKGNLRKSATQDEQKQAHAMAFLVARAIRRRGIKPRPWFERVVASQGVSTLLPLINEAAGALAELYAYYAAKLGADSVNRGKGP